jgi:predicted nucleic acid-binding protein
MSTSSPVYVLDTNVFVQAHRRHYAFEICPGFWDCLIHHHETGRLVSIDRVRDEILAGDTLETWTKDSAPASLFATTADALVVRNYADMVRWVQANSQFNSEAKTEFARVADAWLCAYAKANGKHIVVTHEELNPQAKRRVPLPNVCKEFGVDYVDPFAMLKDRKVRFQWSA